MTDTYQLTPSSAVIRLSDNQLIYPDSEGWPAYQAWLDVPNTPAPARALTNAEEFASRIAAGLTIVSSSNPTAINGIYAVDPSSQQVIAAIYAGIKGNDGLPAGGATFNYADIIGVNHSFGAADFTGFAKAARDFIYAMIQAARQPTPSWPNSTVTIA